MPADPEDDFKKLWRSQKLEGQIMTIENVRGRAAKLRRDENIRTGIAYGMALTIMPLMLWQAWIAVLPLAKAGLVLMAFGIGYVAWRARARGSDQPEGASADALIAFHQAILLRNQRSFLQMLLTATPVLVGAFLVAGGWMLHGAPWPRLIPLAGLILFWLTWAFFLQRYQSRKIREELDQLEKLQAD